MLRCKIFIVSLVIYSQEISKRNKFVLRSRSGKKFIVALLAMFRANFRSNLTLLHFIEIMRASFLPVAWISVLLYLDPFLFAAIKIEDFL